MRLSPHFNLSEFTVSQTASRLGLSNVPNDHVVSRLRQVAYWLEGARTLLGAPIIITSGYRSPEVNKAVGGSGSSCHMDGDAADFVCPGYGSNEAVMRRLASAGMKFDQLILEFPPNGWIHVGLGGRMRNQLLIIDNKGTREWMP